MPGKWRVQRGAADRVKILKVGCATRPCQRRRAPSLHIYRDGPHQDHPRHRSHGDLSALRVCDTPRKMTGSGIDVAALGLMAIDRSC
jgi:hypothetical protein